MELETANSIDRNMDSSSPKGSPSSQSDNDSEKDPSQKDKRSPKSEKGSNKNEAPSPKSSSSSDGSGSVQSPPSKTPPSPLPSSSPLTTPSTQPPLSSRSPKELPPTKLQSSPPPPPYLLLLPPPLPSPSSSSPPLSSPPPLPSSGKDDNSSHNPPKQSPPPSSEAPSPSVTPSSSQTPNNSSSRNSPPPSTVTPLGSSSPSQSHNSPPALRRGDQATNSISNHPSPPYSPSLSIGSQPRSRGFSNDSLPSTSGRGDSDNSSPVKYVSIALVGVCIIALVAICLLVAIMRKRKRGAVYDVSYMPPLMKAGVDGHYYGQQPLQESHYKNASQNGTMHPLGASESAKPKSAQTGFSYESIMEITNGFSIQNIIGEGGFGCVYKGWLTDGRVVAVKKLKADSGQGEREFRAEVEIISRVHHRHLVSLVGYCISERHKILMYEFVPNGTLDHHLHGKGMPVLDWTKRVKIAIGAAKGLAYLHEDCNPKIIHRDIKSANILLDDAYVAQVSDFGLARLTDDANTHVSTRVMGTFGYMAPEYATSGKLTDRSDVFSFGVVLLELLTGRKPVDQTQPLGEESLVEWARPLLIHAVETGDFSKLIDPKLERQFVESEMLRMIEAATACVRHSAPKRPRMLQVARALDSEGELVDLSNGVKYGQSTIYNSGQYDEEIMRFRMMNGCSFGNSEFDMYSAEYSSRELSGFQRAWVQDSSVVESKSIAFNRHGSRHTKEHR